VSACTAALAAAPGKPDYQEGLANLHRRMGRVHGAAGKFAQAVGPWEKELVLRRALVEAQPGSARHRYFLADCLAMLARGHLLTDRPARAVNLLRESLRQRTILARRPGASPRTRIDLAEAHAELGQFLVISRKERKAALASYRAAARVWEKVEGELPAAELAPHRRSLGDCLSALGQLLLEQGEAAQAEQALVGAVRHWKVAVRGSPTDATATRKLGGNACNLGLVQVLQGKHRQALANFDLAVRTLAGAQEKLGRKYLCNSHSGRALALRGLQRYALAVADLDRALALDDGTRRDELRLKRADVLARMGDHARAAAEARALIEPKLDGAALYDLACVFALASAGAQRDPAVPLAVRERLAERHAEQALALLERARQVGLFKDGKTREKLKTDADLAFLRRRADFRAWLARP
jgi:tetratricopeptide (TPR) repeat protein